MSGRASFNMNMPSVRRSSRIKSSPFFGGTTNQKRTTASPYFASNDDGLDSDTTAEPPLPPEDAPTTAKRARKADKPSIDTSSPTKKARAKIKVTPSKSTSTDAAALKSIERTRSFEAAWWGNILQNQTHSTITITNSDTSTSDTSTSAPSNSKESPVYPPIHTLILGTHPSTASLSTNQFYGHPLNAFWYLVGDSLGFRRCSAVSPATHKPYKNFYPHLRYEHIVPYETQLTTLVRHGFALWDIVRECEREGSLDVDITQECPNAIREFCEQHRSVKRIIIANGTTGGKLFKRHFKTWFDDGGIVVGENDMSVRTFGVRAFVSGGSGVAVKKGEGRPIEVVCLPSVSPAAAKFSYLEKREVWEKECFNPGLADYDEWKRRIGVVGADKTTPQKNVHVGARNVTPSPSGKGGNAGPKVSTADTTPIDLQNTKASAKTAKQTTQNTTPTASKASPFRFQSSDIEKLSPQNDWVDLQVPPEELRPSATLTNGQCFNWMVVDSSEQNIDDVESSLKQSAWGTHDAKEWIGPLNNRVLSIRETANTTLYRVLHGPMDGASNDLRKYFCLETPLAPLYKEWSKTDARLAKIASVIPGCRILRQDPLECMFSFICSSNNNIPRITKMLTSFRQQYGTFMMDIPTQKGDTVSIYSFPNLDSLSSATEEELRNMGLGYRAKYIIETRDMLSKRGGNDFLFKLRTEKDSQAVQDELIAFSGIGRKVADCIALFSLDQHNAISVDVHVQHIASRDYDSSVLGSAKSITPTIYKQVGDLFRTRFPRYAGWAHSLLFVAELPSFRGVLPADVVREMDEWRELEQRRKKELKRKKSA